MLDIASFLRSLEEGRVRAAERREDEQWVVNVEVKQNILDVFRKGVVEDMGRPDQPQYKGFPDKSTLLPRMFSPSDRVRVVPGGTSVRAGAYIGKDVVIMPPSYINIGAYVGDGTMVDSNVLVGSCAQIGKNVHLSAAAQICGVLEPVGDRPTIIEDKCFVGAGVIVAEGIIVREGAVLAAGVILTASVPIYDLTSQSVIKGEIPAGAVVVPGTRPASCPWASSMGLSLSCAVIVKYRDEKTEKSVKLEDILRNTKND